MKALEDLSMQYDMTVRNSERTVVQFSYGDDGLNPHVMETGDRPVDYGRLTLNICSSHACPTESCLTGAQIRELARCAVNSERIQNLRPGGLKFIEETEEFFSKVAFS